MKFRAATALSLLFTLAILPAAFAHGGDAAATPSPTPTLLTRTLQILHLKHRDKTAASSAASGPGDAVEIGHQFEIKMSVTPSPVTLSDTRQVQVTVSLANRSKKIAHLDFPTSQRIDVLVINSAGKTLTQWSEDQSFTGDPGSITINPDERLEYNASVSTREMAAGQAYTVEAFFPKYPDFKIDRKVSAQQ